MSERQWVTAGLFGLTVAMLAMTLRNPGLWDVKLFEVILQAVVLTGLLNMVVAFHFAANKQDEQRAQNTAKAFEAITATAQSHVTTDASAAAQHTADAAQEQADAIKGTQP
jgi:cytoskeletal protein RodZ